MRVLLDTTYVARRAGRTGTGVYLAHLVPALRDGGVDVVEAQAPHRLREGWGDGADLRASVRRAVRDRRWARTTLPRLAARLRADLVHHPLPARSPGIPSVVTVHDLAPLERPDLFDRRFVAHVASAHRAAARAADAVVVPSRTTAAAVLTRWGLSRGDVVVAHHGPGQAPAPASTPLHERHEVLVVADDEPRKGLDLLAPLAALLARDHGLTVRRARPEDDLAVLLGRARALVHPAVHEGFGLPCLEALHAGVPVVAFPSAAVREVCGAAIRYATTAADVAAAVVADPPDREVLLARAARFSWKRCAEAHVLAYRRALAGSVERSP